MPSRKVTVGVLAGSIAGLIVWSVKVFAGLEIPAEQGIGLSVILTFVLQYFMKDVE